MRRRVRVAPGDDDVRDQPLELVVGACFVDPGQPLVELVHGQPALAGGAPEQLGVVFAVGVGGPQLGERVVGHPSQRTFRAMSGAVT